MTLTHYPSGVHVKVAKGWIYFTKVGVGVAGARAVIGARQLICKPHWHAIAAQDDADAVANALARVTERVERDQPL